MFVDGFGVSVLLGVGLDAHQMTCCGAAMLVCDQLKAHHSKARVIPPQHGEHTAIYTSGLRHWEHLYLRIGMSRLRTWQSLKHFV